MMHILLFGLLYVTTVHCSSSEEIPSYRRKFDVLIMDEGKDVRGGELIHFRLVPVFPRHSYDSCNIVRYIDPEFRITRITVGTNSGQDKHAEIVEGGINDNHVGITICSKSAVAEWFDVRIFGKVKGSQSTDRPRRRTTTTTTEIPTRRTRTPSSTTTTRPRRRNNDD